MTTMTIEEAIGTVTPVFWWNWLAKTFYVVNQGGTSSSKTYSIMQVLALLAAQDKGPTVTTVVGEDLTNLRVGPMRDLMKIIRRSPLLTAELLERNKATSTWTFRNGAVIEFNSFQDAQDAQSGKRDRLFVNEANAISVDIFLALAERTGSDDPEVRDGVWIDFNPTSRFWAFKEFEGRKDATWLFSNFTHNPYVPTSVVKSLLKYKTSNPRRWRILGQGLLGHSELNVYSNWSVVDEPFPEEGKGRGKGLDFGYGGSPTACVRACLYNGAIYVQLLVYERTLRIGQLAKKLKLDQWPEEEIVADSAYPESIATLSIEHGLKIKGVKKGPNSIEEGIEILSGYPIKVLRHNSEWLVVEFENYVRTKGKDGELGPPIKNFNHAMDALRYWAIENLRPTPEVRPYEDPGLVVFST